MKQKLLLLLLMMMNVFALLAQTTQTIKGKITDETGAPLQGVTILIKGTKIGAQTDASGAFSIKTSAVGKVELMISSTGFTAQTVTADGGNAVNIKLVRSVEQIDDVVVIGYQTVKKKDVLASVSSVTAKDLKDIPVNSAAEALAGRLAGVQITTAEGSPDANIRIRVRGGGSVSQDNSPLYIVDGVQVENALNLLSPQDIQSIDVLKDAAATAIYGARGANGVVIITTKSGKTGKLNVVFNSFLGWKQLPKELAVMNPYDFVMWEYERTRPSSGGYGYGAGSTDSATFAKRYGTTWDTLNAYKNVPYQDWQKAVLGNRGFSQMYNVGFNGGNKKTTFNFSYTHNDDKAIALNSAYRRNLVSFKLDHNANAKLKMGFSVRVVDQTVYGAGTSDDKSSSYNRLRNIVKYRPFLSPGLDESQIDPALIDPSIGNGLILVNPIQLSNSEYRKKTTNAMNMTAYVNYQIAKNFSFRTTLGIDYNNVNDRQFSDSITPYSIQKGGQKPIAENDTFVVKTLTNSNVFTYALNGYKKKHDISIVVGEETYKLNADSSKNVFRDYATWTSPDKAFETQNTANIFAGYPKYTKIEFTSLSFFGRVNYAYKKKYLFSANLRADASSKFASNLRWGYFPSASFAWRISKEKFMDKFGFINDMKLRLGYGEVGNNRIPDYLYINTFLNNQSYYGLNGQLVYGYTSAGLINPNLQWETTVNRNVGLDITILKSRLTLAVDYYSNTTTNLLLNTPIAPTYGYTSQYQNIGSTSNKGWEFQLNAGIVQKKNFSWNANFNISFNKNRVEGLAKGQNSYFQQGWSGVSGQPADYIVKIGQPVGAMWGWITDGFYKVEDFDYNAASKTYTLKSNVVNSSTVTGPPQPGTLKLKDLNGDGKVDIDNDRTIIGDANPKFVGGLNQQFILGNFDASIFVNFVYGNSIYNANKIEFTNGYTPNSNLLAIMKDRWKTIDGTGQVVTDPNALTALNANAKIWRPLTSTGAFYLHSWAIEDGSFLRINNVSLGYSIRNKTLTNMHINKLRVYGTVNNLAVFTSYSGYDPEVNVRSNSGTTPGLDYSAYPKSRSFIIGLNVSFQ
ncbi:MAG: TonB-dependent receptor [Sphingobacteriia bacterium]|nr:TonB-dependent receptor [Sphingobacteriia bacterium]